MAAKFRKIDPRIWDDEKFVSLNEQEKLVAIYCLTCQQSNRIGIFVFSPAMAAEKIGTSVETFRKRFGNVCQTLFWGWDNVLRVLYFPSWWKYNQPENENVLKGALNDLADIPASPLVKEFCGNVRYLPESMIETFRKRLANVTPQEQEQKQQQKQKQEQEKEHNQEPPVGCVGFDLFWTYYPRRVAKPNALKAWNKINPDNDLVQKIVQSIENQKATTWKGKEDRFIPHPATWLNARRWEDDLEKPAPDLMQQIWDSGEEFLKREKRAMTRNEFLEIMRFVGVAVQKNLASDALEVYFELLGDLDARTLQLGVKKVLLERPWPSFPTVGELRNAAVDVQMGNSSELSPARAWELSEAVIARTDPDIDGDFARQCAKLKTPEIVIRAIRAFGMEDLCRTTSPASVLRGQFMKVFEQIAQSAKREALLPPAVKAEIERKRIPISNPSFTALVNRVGRKVEGN